MQRKTLHKQYKKLGISAVRRIGFRWVMIFNTDVDVLCSFKKKTNLR